MPIWLVTFLTKLIEPIIMRMVDAVAAKLEEIRKANENERIDKATEALKKAQTPEDLKNAAKALQDAIRHL